MSGYLLRRVLLAPITLVGVTFVVFMLVALSPGGVGLESDGFGEGGGGGGGGSGGRGVSSADMARRAYLVGRYGLDESPVLQYGRWLRAACPVKLGGLDMADESGERVRLPSAPAPPLDAPLDGAPAEIRADLRAQFRAQFRAWLLADRAEPSGHRPGTPVAAPGASDAGAIPLEPRPAYRQASAAFNEACIERLDAAADLELALRGYARAIGIPEEDVTDQRRLWARLATLAARPEDPKLAAVRSAARAAEAAHDRVLAAHDRLRQAIAARPYPDSGLAIIPGVLGLDWPDLGVSLVKRRPVLALISERLPVTLMLNALAFALVYLIGVPGGVIAASQRGRAADRLLGLGVIALWSIPLAWAGSLAIGFLASDRSLGWFPVTWTPGSEVDAMPFLPSWNERGVFERGFLLDTGWRLCLPVLCLTYGGLAVLSKQTRAAMLESLSSDYIRTARAKGVPEGSVLWSHALRNSLLPIITLFSGAFPAMLSGSVVVERIFNIPGMGSLVLEAIAQRDRELLVADVAVIGAVNIAALLLADVLYAVADPRVRRP